jgi:D-glycero-alpha-D-manno-heptose 1-phosphate guanylyltransferase
MGGERVEAVVLAGGFGTRLRSVVSHVPKPMAPLGGKPFLELLLRSLRAKGITRVILSVGYMFEAITAYFDEHPPGISVAYQVERTPLGTGGAIAAALNLVTTDRTFVFNGDTYLDLDLQAVSAMWPGDGTPIVVARWVPDAERFGKLECAQDRIMRFLGTGHKGPGLINAGCYLLPKTLFCGRELPTTFSFESDFLAKCAPSYLRLFRTSGRFIDIGEPSDYLRAELEFGTSCAGRSLEDRG